MNQALVRRLAGRALTVILTIVLGGVVCATMVRFAPGFEVDEEQLDPRLSSESIAALRSARSGQDDVVRFYLTYLRNALHGDLGMSRTLERPVRTLLAERLPVTARLVALGLAIAWCAGLTVALSCFLFRSSALDAGATVATGALLCIPAAVLALVTVYLNAPGAVAVAAIVFPKVFRYSRNLLDVSHSMPHLTTAHAKGVGAIRILVWHVLPIAGPQLLALLGVSASIALSAAVPVEVLCSIPGIAQLAWQAALSRDLPLIVNLTVIVTTVVMIANSATSLIKSPAGGAEQ